MAGSQSASSLADIWNLFDSPVFPPGINLPSALQTPRALTARSNDAQEDTGAPPPNQAAATAIWRVNTRASLAERENIPPASEARENERPDANPVQPDFRGDTRGRKRRRGKSPASGERAKKRAARRKEKARTIARSSAHPTRHEYNSPSPIDNPWASNGPSATHATTTRDALNTSPLPPSSLPTTPTPTRSVTTPSSLPYSTPETSHDPRNLSGSYPTPHRMSDSSRAASSVPAAVQGRFSNTQARFGFEASSTPFGNGASLLERDSGRDISMGDDRSRANSTESRRQLRDLLSDPRTMDEEPYNYRSPTVEDDQEEGELDAMRYARQRHRERRHDHTGANYAPNDIARSSEAGPSRREVSEDHSRWTSAHRREAVSRSFTEGTESRYTDEWHARTPRRMARDSESSRWASPRTVHLPSVAPPRHTHHGAHSATFHSPSSTSTPSNRIHGLDIFDVGDEENLPEAVRRAIPGGEDEESPTPIPREGDPEVHRQDPETFLQGMSDDWVREVWADTPGTSFTLHTFNPRFTRSYGSNRRTAADIRSAVRRITNETNFRVIAPDQSPNNRGRGPLAWAVTGLSREGVDIILRRRTWSFKTIMFFPQRRALEIPSHLLSLEGFLEDNVEGIHAAVRSTFERPQIRQRIEQMLRANPEYATIPIDEAFRRLMSSLRVTVYTLDNDTVVANVFLCSPTRSVRVWRQWVQELRVLTFGSYHTAIARARRISTCAGCSGTDHPTHLCPFPGMQGWNGPEQAGGSSYSTSEQPSADRLNSAPAPTQSHDRSRNRPMYGPDSSQAGPSRSQSNGGSYDWEETQQGRGRGRGRRDAWSHRGQPRRDRRDGSGPPKGSRDGRGKDGWY